jgi:FKBP-type peptidyl-prolyl cis-trans isomerase FkpA
MRLLAPLLIALLLAPVVAPAQNPAAPPQTPPAATAPSKADAGADEETLYALGILMSRELKPLSLTPSELESVKRGLTDALTGAKPQVDAPKYEQKIQALAKARIAATAQKNKEAGKAFTATAAQEKGAQKTASGAIYSSLKEGTGATPKATDTVKVKLVGKLPDGTVFDDGSRGENEFMLGSVFKCLSEGIAKMKVGGKARLVCPSETAFGDQGSAPAVLPGAAVIFEVDLLAARATPKTSKPPGHPMGGAGGMPRGHP